MVLTAVISEIPYDLAVGGKIMDWSSQNAMVTMSICLIMLKCLDIFKDGSGFTGGLVRMLIVLAAVVWVSLFRAEYGLCMVLLTAVFYVFYTQNILKTVLGCIISLVYITGPLSFNGIWCTTVNEKTALINMFIMLFIQCICWCLE